MNNRKVMKHVIYLNDYTSAGERSMRQKAYSNRSEATRMHPLVLAQGRVWFQTCPFLI
jgi:hypothetical protein